MEGSKSCNLGKGAPNPETTGSGNCCCNPEEHLTMAITDLRLLLLLLLLFGSRLCHLFFALKHIPPPSTQTCLTGGAPQTKYAEGGLCKTSEIAPGDPTRAGICSHNSFPQIQPRNKPTAAATTSGASTTTLVQACGFQSLKAMRDPQQQTKQRRLFFSFLSLRFLFFVGGLVVVVVVVSLLQRKVTPPPTKAVWWGFEPATTCKEVTRDSQ